MNLTVVLVVGLIPPAPDDLGASSKALERRTEPHPGSPLRPKGL